MTVIQVIDQLSKEGRKLFREKMDEIHDLERKYCKDCDIAMCHDCNHYIEEDKDDNNRTD